MEEKKKQSGNSTIKTARDMIKSTVSKGKYQNQPPNELSAIIPNDTLMSLGQGPGLLSSSFQPPSAIFGAIASKIGLSPNDLGGGRLQDSLTLERGLANGLIATPFGETDFKVRELQELCMDQKSVMDQLQRQNFKLKKQIQNNPTKSQSATPPPNNTRTTPYKNQAIDVESTNNKKAFSTIGKTQDYGDDAMMFHAQSMGINSNNRQEARKMMTNQHGNDDEAKSMLTQLNAKGMASLSSKGRQPGLSIDVFQQQGEGPKDATLSDLISSAKNRKPKWMKKKGNHRHQSSLFYNGAGNEQEEKNHKHHHSKKSTMVFHESPIPATSGMVSRGHQHQDFPTLGNKRSSHIKTPPSISKSHKTSIADSYLKQLAEESNTGIQLQDEVPEFGGMPSIPDRDDDPSIVSPLATSMKINQRLHNHHSVEKNESFSSEEEQGNEDEDQNKEWLLKYNPNIKIPQRINANIIVDEQFYDQAMQQGSICMYEVTHDFQADDKRCLKLRERDVVYGFYTVEGWLFGFKKDNEHEYGFMPNNYVKIIEF